MFKISEAANLAIHALTYLASRPDSSPVPTGTVARELGVSEAHLTKVFQRLKKEGLVRSIRGPKGGIALRKEPGAVRLMEIYQAIDGTPGQGTCLLNRRECPFAGCVFGDMLAGIRDQVADQLSQTTLADLASQPDS